MDSLDDQVRQLTRAWRQRREIPGVLQVWRNRSVLKSVWSHKVTSCAQWRVDINDLQQLDGALNEFIQIFQLAFSAGPRILNEVVWGEACPLAWCTCCDEMANQLYMNIETSTRNAAALDHSLYHWDTTNESSEYRELRTALERYPHSQYRVPVMRLTLVLYRHNSRNNHSERGQSRMQKFMRLMKRALGLNPHIARKQVRRLDNSVQRLLDHTAINGDYDVKLRWGDLLCSEHVYSLENKQRHSTSLQNEDNYEMCPLHHLNHLSIVLIDGDVSTYVPTRVRNFRMRCGGRPEVMLYAKPPQDTQERKQQMNEVCHINTRSLHKHTSLCYGRLTMVKNKLGVFVWNTNPLVEGIHPEVMEWGRFGVLTSDCLERLLTLVGGNLRQLRITSPISISHLIRILNGCPLLNKIYLYKFVWSPYDSVDVSPKTYSNLRALTVVLSRDTFDPNFMIKSVVMLAGESLERLKVYNNSSGMNSEVANTIARACPHLLALQVFGVDDDFCDALVRCFDAGYLSKVKALTVSLERYMEEADHSILIALQDSNRAITRCVRDFSVMRGGWCYEMRSYETMAIMEDMLAMNDSLVNVQLWGTMYEECGGQTVRRSVERMPLRHTCAFLSGLQRILGMRMYNHFPIELIKQILISTGRNRLAHRIGMRSQMWANDDQHE